MSLTDPTAGAGYGFGQKLPSAHMTTLATQVVRAADATNGSSHTLTGTLAIGGSGTVTINPATFNLGATAVNFLGTLNTFATATQVNTGTAFTWKGVNSTDVPRIDQRDYVFEVPLVPVANNNARWSFNTTNLKWQHADVTDAGLLVFKVLNMPALALCKLKDVIVYLDGNGAGGSHASIASMTKPHLIVSKVAHATGVGTNLCDATDPSADAAAYDALHFISAATHGSMVVDTPAESGQSYYIGITGETGTNAANNRLQIQGVVALFQVTHIGP
jgi:hypothetical protein